MLARTLRVFAFRLALIGVGLIVGVWLAGLSHSAGDKRDSNSDVVIAQQATAQGCEPTWRVVQSPDVETRHNYLNDIGVVAANDIWAVGYYETEGGRYKTLAQHWDGSQWSVVSSPNPGDVVNELRAVAVASSNNVWAVGRSTNGSGSPTNMLVMRWDGSTWATVILPEPGTANNTLFDVAVISPDNVWVAGAYNDDDYRWKTLAEHWDGSQWSVVPTPNVIESYNDYLHGLAAVSANDIWAVGRYNSLAGTHETLVQHWDGSQWSIVSSPGVGTEYNALIRVDAISVNNVWAVGLYYDTYGTKRTLVEHWNGAQWSVVPSPNIGPGDNILNDVAAISASNVWAVGDYYEGNAVHPLTMHWDGTVWSVVTSPGSGQYNTLRGVGAVSAGDLWAVGNYYNSGPNRTLTMHYTPQCGTPSPSATPTPTCRPGFDVVPSTNAGSYDNNRLHGIAVLTPNNVWAVGTHVRYASYDTEQTLIIHWNGAQWSIVPSPNAGTGKNVLSAVSALSPNDVWAVGSYIASPGVVRALIMHWDGNQWSIIPEPPVDGTALSGVSALAPNDVWAVGTTNHPHMLIEHWDGQSWSVIAGPSVVSPYDVLAGVSALAPNDVWAVGYYCPESCTRLQTLTIHWDGSLWSVVPSPNSGSLGNMLYAVSARAPGDVWAVGAYDKQNAGNQEKTLTMRWDGSQWTIIPSPNPGLYKHQLLGVAALGANDVWAVGCTSCGGGDKTLIEHWDGNQWSVIASPNNNLDYNTLSSVSARPTAPDNVWVAGTWLNRHKYQTLVQRYYNTCPGPSPTPLPTATPTPCTSNVYSDVPPGSTFYPYITCLSTHGFIGGYSDCTFRPQNSITRAQLSKIVSNAAGFNEAVSGQLFEDVPPSNGFYTWIQRLASRGYMGGYPCGGLGEPCVPPGNRSYFRPNLNATRGQISKIVSNAAQFNDPPGEQRFEDSPPGSTFYLWIERLASRGIIGGYPCGGQGEPCGVGNLPYFRPNSNATRGQASKIVANAFNCSQVETTLSKN